MESLIPLLDNTLGALCTVLSFFPKPFSLYIFTCSPCRMRAFVLTQQFLKSIIRFLQWYLNFTQYNHYTWPATSINIHTVASKQLGHLGVQNFKWFCGQFLSSQRRPPSHAEWCNLLKERKHGRITRGEMQTKQQGSVETGHASSQLKSEFLACCLALRQSTLKCWKSAQEVRAGQKEEKWKNRTLIWTYNCKFYSLGFFFPSNYKSLMMLLLLASCAWAHRIMAVNKLKAIFPAIDVQWVHSPQRM